MRIRFPQLIISAFLLVATNVTADTFRIAFGSCYDQNQPSETIWQSIKAAEPQLMILTGDNVYVDSGEPEKFANDYALLAANKGFASLSQTTNIMATWDDHDYGMLDGGKHFSAKQIAKEYFVNFYGYSELQNIPTGRGIEHSRRITVGDKVIQIILPDTRWYRDDLLLNSLSKEAREKFQLGYYRPHTDVTQTVLGESQWQWLEAQLKQPADLNIIVSGIHVIPEYNAWEAWSNFPHERLRLLKLINKYSPGKTVILSGDIHRAETSKIEMGDWQLFELTSSGLSAKVYPGKPNVHRYGVPYIDYNFGLLDIEFTENGIQLQAGYYSTDGKPLTEFNIPMNHQEHP